MIVILTLSLKYGAVAKRKHKPRGQFIPMADGLPPFALKIPERTLFKADAPTTTKYIEVAYAVHVPLPVQVAIPAIKPPAMCDGDSALCPQCPPCICYPSCTPAFYSYCSPCHQKCRCRSSDDTPVPMLAKKPIPVPGPAYPVAIKPIGPPSVYVVPHAPPEPLPKYTFGTLRDFFISAMGLDSNNSSDIRDMSTSAEYVSEETDRHERVRKVRLERLQHENKPKSKFDREDRELAKAKQASKKRLQVNRLDQDLPDLLPGTQARKQWPAAEQDQLE